MPEEKVRFVTFNVCGIKGILSRSAQWVSGKSFESMFELLHADVVCFQETKIQSADITKDMAIVPNFNSYFTCSQARKGYAGVAIYVRNTVRVLKAEEGLTGMLSSGPPGNITTYRSKKNAFDQSIYPDGMSEHHGRKIDEQGRSITLDLGSCVVIGLYCPADSQGNMGDYREEFFQLLDWRVSKLRELGREVIVLGDLNVAREPRDSATLRDQYMRSHVEIDTEDWKYGSVPRKAVNDWVEDLGFIDTSRQFHETRADMYTCWDQQKNCRPANFGSRIDYILVTKGIECVGADIMPELVGSDHCPVYADIILDIQPQAAFKVPYLSRSLSDRWKGSIVSFFGKGQSSHKRPLPHTEETSNKKIVKDETKLDKLDAKPDTEPEPEAKPDAEPDTKPGPETKPDTRPDAKPETKPASDPDAKPGTKPDAGPDAEPAKPDAKPDTNPDTKPDAEPDTKPGSRPKADPEPKSKSHIYPETQSTLAEPGSPNRKLAADPTASPSSPSTSRSNRQLSISQMFGSKNDNWKKVSHKLEAPLCEHHEPCILKKSTKPPRKGEHFWICNRSMGGKTNRSGQNRCKTFIWDTGRK